MRAFWDDLASDMEIPEFADAYWAACERIASQIAGQEVPCPGAEEAHAEWWMPSTGCPWCGAVV